MTHLLRISATLCLFVLAACATMPPSETGDRSSLNARVFDRAWSLVQTRYYDAGLQSVDWAAQRRAYRPQALAAADENALYGAIGAMLDGLNDEHVYAQSPAEVRREALGQTERPLFGVRIVRRGALYLVDDVWPGGAADEAGVEVGWLVESADGRPYDVGVARTAGAPVTIVFRDSVGERRTLSIAPRTARPPIERRPLRRAGEAYVVAFDSFDPGTADWLYRQLQPVPNGAPVIVDLRDNVGGRIVEVERTLGCFLPRGAPVAHMRSRGGRGQAAVVLGGCPNPVEGSVSVLVGRRSRSGAEMFAAALQEAGRATVVGDRTAGALLSSLQHPLPDGGRITISEADFITAQGNRIERFGLPPDITAPTTQADRRAGRDPGLTAALAALSREPLSVRSATPETAQ